MPTSRNIYQFIGVVLSKTTPRTDVLQHVIVGFVRWEMDVQDCTFNALCNPGKGCAFWQTLQDKKR